MHGSPFGDILAGGLAGSPDATEGAMERAAGVATLPVAADRGAVPDGAISGLPVPPAQAPWTEGAWVPRLGPPRADVSPDGDFYEIPEGQVRKLGFTDWAWFGGGPGEGPGGGGAGGGFGDWSWFGGREKPTPPTPPEFLPDVGGYTGAGQAIVVIDDGFSDLYDQSNTVFGFDYFDGDDDAEVSKIDSHGSQVAQVAIQQAAEVDIIHLKAFPNAGEVAANDAIAQSLQWVVDNAEAFNVAAVNLSLGFGNVMDEIETEFSDELAAIADLGIFNIVAAGNSGLFFEEGVNVLAADPNAVAVSATNDDDLLAFFSQRSETLTDIAAIGEGVRVQTRANEVLEIDGTSFAAPLVSGVAALLQEASEDVNGERLDEPEFLEILRDSGRDVRGEPDDVPGYRIADPVAAVEYFLDNAERYDDPDPVGGDGFLFA